MTLPGTNIRLKSGEEVIPLPEEERPVNGQRYWRRYGLNAPWKEYCPDWLCNAKEQEEVEWWADHEGEDDF